MPMAPSRRQFFGGLAATAAWPLLSRVAGASPAAPGKKAPLKLGLASYSMREFTLDQALDMAKQMGVKYMTFKDVHVPRAAREDRGGGHHDHGRRHDHDPQRPGADQERVRVREERRLPAHLHRP